MTDTAVNPETRLKAALAMLERGYGKATEANPATEIIERFATGEFSAITAGLMFEAHGLEVPILLGRYLNNSIDRATFVPLGEKIAMGIDEAPPALPLE